jgi:uncharacterized protein (TIGR00661 family)
MRIFYGVNGTGNGHISRARAMAKEFNNAGIEVQYMFSGREPNQYFDMEIFGDAWYRKGLTFSIESGKINKWKTLTSLDLLTFFNDVSELNLYGYDRVITDYEPITSMVASRRNIKTIGLGHQYAFTHDIPIVEGEWLSKFIMKHYAPADIGLGMHWHHFNQAILPPIIDTELTSVTSRNAVIVVYLPFEKTETVIALLKPFSDFKFEVFGCDTTVPAPAHITIRNVSQDFFKNTLVSCSGVICNAGFELPSEVLALGKKLLVKPVQGQMEQESNALALNRLGYGAAVSELTTGIISKWLYGGSPVKVNYPNVAEAIVNWLHNTEQEIPVHLWETIESGLQYEFN